MIYMEKNNIQNYLGTNIMRCIIIELAGSVHYETSFERAITFIKNTFKGADTSIIYKHKIYGDTYCVINNNNFIKIIMETSPIFNGLLVPSNPYSMLYIIPQAQNIGIRNRIGVNKYYNQLFKLGYNTLKLLNIKHNYDPI